MPHNRPVTPLNGLGLARPQASAQTVENENEGSPEHASLGSRALSTVDQAVPTEWALSASGKPTAEASWSGASLGMGWSGVDARLRSRSSSLLNHLRSTSGTEDWTELAYIPIQHSPETKALNKLSTEITSCNTLAEHVRELREVASGDTTESLATAFKQTCPFLTLAPNGDICAQIVSLMLRKQFHVWVGKLRNEQLNLEDCCNPRDPHSLKRGENRMQSIKFLTTLPHNCNDWLRVALLSGTEMTGEEELTEENKQAKSRKYLLLKSTLSSLLPKVIFPNANGLSSLRVKLDEFDRDAAHVGLQAIVCFVKDVFPSLKLPDDADPAIILNALEAYHAKGGRTAENTLNAFWPEVNVVSNLFKKLKEGWSIEAYISNLKTATKSIPGLGPESVCKMHRLKHPNSRIPPGISISYENVLPYLLRCELISRLYDSNPAELDLKGQMPDIQTRWRDNVPNEKNQLDWIKLIWKTEPDCRWAAAALLSDKQLIGEETLTRRSAGQIKNKENQLRKSLCGLMPEVLDPNTPQSDDLLNRIDQFDKDAASFGLQWMVARIKTRHPEIELHATAEANEILAAVRRHYERTPQKQRQPEKALLEALRDTIQSRADLRSCRAVLTQGQKHLKDVTCETLLQQFKLRNPELRPRSENFVEDIVSLMLRHELSLELKGQGPAANEWQRPDRCRLSEPLFSGGRDDNKRLFFKAVESLCPGNRWLAMAMLSDKQLTGEEKYKKSETEQALKNKMHALRQEKDALTQKILEPQKNPADGLLQRMDEFDHNANRVGLQWIIETIREGLPGIDLPLCSDAQQILDTVRCFHASRPQAETSASRQPGTEASDSARTERQGRRLLEPES